MHPKHLILAGGAAGISAAFNTPLAGIVSISLQGNYTYFGHLAVGSIDSKIIVQVIVCALVCGVPGGIFAPSLSIGAGIGNDLLPLFGSQHAATAIVALCMAGLLAAVTQAPITSFIIVMEMIDGHEMVISLMAVTMIAAIVSRMFSPALYAMIADVQISRTSGSKPE